MSTIRFGASEKLPDHLTARAVGKWYARGTTGTPDDSDVAPTGLALARTDPQSPRWRMASSIGCFTRRIALRCMAIQRERVAEKHGTRVLNDGHDILLLSSCRACLLLPAYGSDSILQRRWSLPARVFRMGSSKIPMARALCFAGS
jgi:hypothetical protein